MKFEESKIDKIMYHLNRLIGYECEKQQHIDELADLGVEVQFCGNDRVQFIEGGEVKVFYKKV